MAEEDCSDEAETCYCCDAEDDLREAAGRLFCPEHYREVISGDPRENPDYRERNAERLAYRAQEKRYPY